MPGKKRVTAKNTTAMPAEKETLNKIAGRPAAAVVPEKSEPAVKKSKTKSKSKTKTK